MSTWANSLNIKTSTVPVYPIKSMVTMKKPTFPFILKQAMKRSKKFRAVAKVIRILQIHSSIH